MNKQNNCKVCGDMKHGGIIPTPDMIHCGECGKKIDSFKKQKPSERIEEVADRLYKQGHSLEESVSVAIIRYLDEQHEKDK